MKSMLYVGASLMIGASIYGFVDYKQSQGKKEFTQMYKEVATEPAEVVEPVVTVVKEEPATNEKTAKNTEIKTAKKEISVEKEPAIRAIGDDEKITTANVTLDDSKVEVKAKPEVSVKKTKKKKRLDHKIFSRAPLREEIIDIAPEDLKVEEKAEVKADATKG